MENSKQKILMSCPYFPPQGGGLERYTFEISEALSNEYDIVVVTSGEKFENDTLEHINNIKVYRLSYYFKIFNTPFSFTWFKKVKKIIKNENPSLINAHMPVPGMADVSILLSKNIPKIITYHSGSMMKKSFFINIFIFIYENTLLKYLLGKSNKIICSSDYIRYGFLKNYLHKSVTITPGVDDKRFHEDLSKKTDYPSILFVAGLNKWDQYKGLGLLIDSVLEIRKTIPNIVLNVVGDGDMRESYENRVRNMLLDENVKFWGKLEGEKLVEKFQKSHVLVSASTNESFSMVILEAMATGLPVIAFDVGSTAQMIENGVNGYLLSHTNKKELTKKITELLSDKVLVTKFGDLNRKKVIEKFTWNIKLDEYLDVINSLKIKRHV